MFGRRLIILVAVLMGLTALAASVAPPPDNSRRTGPQASPTPSAGTPAPTDTAAAAGVIVRRIDATSLQAPVTIEVPRGATLELEVDVGAPDTVALDDLDLEAAAPGSPARIELLADTPGEFPLRLLEAKRALGVVRISAASAAR